MILESFQGSGGMAAVYRGKYLRDEQVSRDGVFAPRDLAIKIGVLVTTCDQVDASTTPVPDEYLTAAVERSEQVRRRLEREQAIYLQLKPASDAIVQVFDTHARPPHRGVDRGENEDRLIESWRMLLADPPYIVMEYILGLTVADRLRGFKGAKVDAITATALFAATARALAKVHGSGVVHRDIKPANLFLVSRDLRTTGVKIGDFGIARSLTEPHEVGPFSGPQPSSVTQAGQVLGTPAYMSPEQWSDPAEADARSDIYSLGVTMYEAVAGEKPFTADNLDMYRAAHTGERPRPPRDIPAKLEQIISRSLARDPADRFGSASELAEALERCNAWEISSHNSRLKKAGRQQLHARVDALQSTLEQLRSALEQGPENSDEAGPQQGEATEEVFGHLDRSMEALAAEITDLTLDANVCSVCRPAESVDPDDQRTPRSVATAPGLASPDEQTPGLRGSSGRRQVISLALAFVCGASLGILLYTQRPAGLREQGRADQAATQEAPPAAGEALAARVKDAQRPGRDMGTTADTGLDGPSLDRASPGPVRQEVGGKAVSKDTRRKLKKKPPRPPGKAKPEPGADELW